MEDIKDDTDLEYIERVEIRRAQIINKLQDIIEIIVHDVMYDGHK